MSRKFFANVTLLGVVCFLLHAHIVLGHTYLSSVQLSGQNLAEGDCVRPQQSPATRDNPILSVLDHNMTCGWLPQAASPANRNCPISPGEQVGIQWHHTDDSSTDDIIATTHKGPCLVYLAKSSDGSGPVWFKIFEQGYDATTQMWCVDNLLAESPPGLLTFTIPPNIEPGNYLLRAEILALHAANVLNGVQPYVGCVQITISGSGTASPSSDYLVEIPGTYSPTDPGMLFNIYETFTSYPIPGPAVWSSGAASPTSAPTPATSAPATSSPTTPKATSAPATSSPATSAPATSAPATSSPTTPKATSRPTGSPTPSGIATSSPTTSTSASTVRVQVYPSSSEWWFAVTTRSTPSVTTIELEDSGSYTPWKQLQTTTWGYWTFPATNPITLPISLRLTASTGAQLVLPNIITSFANNVFVDTGLQFATSSSPTAAPATAAPTQQVTPEVTTEQPTNAPAPAPTTQSATLSPTGAPATTIIVDMHEGSTEWWFAIGLEQVAEGVTIQSISVTDSENVRTWQPLTPTSWGYWTYSTSGSPVVAPLHFEILATSGSVVTFTVPTITPSSDFDSGVQLS